MSNRRAAGNRIRGPHSALTDFLAANNISAHEIRQQHEQRLRLAQAEDDDDPNAATDLPVAPDNTVEATAGSSSRANEGETEAGPSKKRKRNSEQLIALKKKGKPTKAGKKGKVAKKRQDSDDSGDDDYDDSAFSAGKKSKPLPGQLENCELCSKRFTVTPYSKSGPDGGLVCAPCGKQLAKDEKSAAKPKKPAPGKHRRNVESNRLDGLSSLGAKSLQQLCIEKVVQHHADLEEFGEIPENLVGKLSQIFTRNRVLKSNTLDLFLQPDMETVAIHDCAYLTTGDFQKIFAIVPFIKKVVLENACQLKDEVIEYMIDKAQKLEHVHLYGANLVTNEMWKAFFKSRGKALHTLKLQWLDAAFNDEVVESLIISCPNLTRLKLEKCRQIGESSIDSIARLTNLKHLSLQFSQPVSKEALLNLIVHVGPTLETLSLVGFLEADDDVLQAIYVHCRKILKIRFTGNDTCTDAAYTSLFKDWENTRLRFVDFSSNRDVDNSNPNGPELPIGFASGGLMTLMNHSGGKLEHLDIASCRHITHAAFAEVFDGIKIYPELQEVNVSFCNDVDTVIVAGIFKSCPSLKKLVAFGCFGVEDVIVPRGIVLIGVPKAQDSIEQFGNTLIGLDKAMNAMVEASA